MAVIMVSVNVSLIELEPRIMGEKRLMKDRDGVGYID